MPKGMSYEHEGIKVVVPENFTTVFYVIVTLIVCHCSECFPKGFPLFGKHLLYFLPL